MSEVKVEAGEVQEGDFLPGLDNGYVVEVDHDPDVWDGRYNVSMSTGLVLLTFHTAQGEEAYLLCPPDMPVTVKRD